MDKKLNIIHTDIEDVFVIESIGFQDDRGSFSRVFCQNELKEVFTEKIMQINYSVSDKKGTVRGLHFQYFPHDEIKMVKCIKGRVFDVVVDIRKGSKTFLQTYSLELSAKNQKMIYIPKGFAHGFQTLEDDSQLLYLHSNIYTPQEEGGLHVSDPLLEISWPLNIVNLSKRDTQHTFLDKNFKGI